MKKIKKIDKDDLASDAIVSNLDIEASPFDPKFLIGYEVIRGSATYNMQIGLSRLSSGRRKLDITNFARHHKTLRFIIQTHGTSTSQILLSEEQDNM